MFEAINLQKNFYQGFFPRQILPAVIGINFKIAKCQNTGIFGPSGCGKSTLARLLAGLLQPTSGQIFYQNQELNSMPSRQRRSIYRKIQIIFQNPQSSFDPSQQILSALLEPLWVHHLIKNTSQGTKKIIQLLDAVHLPATILSRYPWQISGGQAQRLALARCLSLEPEVLIADEATAMLDISAQAQIISLLTEIQKEKNISIIFISHDASLLRTCTSQTLIMSKGKIMAYGPSILVLPPTSSTFFSLRHAMV